MVTNIVEIVGFALVVLFAFVVWPPSALLVAGLGLMLWAYTTDAGRVRGGSE